MFRGAVPILAVADMTAALRYFNEVLGFATEFTWGDPPTYAGVECDEVELHLIAAAAAAPDGAVAPARVALLLDDVGPYFETVTARGADIVEPLADRPYGLRDFMVRTPDGHLLSFGQSIEP